MLLRRFCSGTRVHGASSKRRIFRLSLQKHSNSSLLRPRTVRHACVNDSTEKGDTADVWTHLQLVKRKLEVATQEEDYKLAAQLRDESKALRESLSPLQQFLHHQAHILHTGNFSEKLAAVRTMAESGDPVVIPDLAAALSDPQMNEVVAGAMWMLFLRCPDPALEDSMVEACRLMADPTTHGDALAALSHLVATAPHFAEAWNKRATLLYMMRRYVDGVDDCREALARQPYHFGAASGMGLCYLMLGKEAEAITAFDQALSINPFLPNISKVRDELKSRAVRRKVEAELDGGVAEGGAGSGSGNGGLEGREEGQESVGENEGGAGV